MNMEQVTNEAGLAALIAGRDAPLRIVGGGTRGMAAGNAETLSVAGLTGVTLYEPGALTLVVRAGTRLAEVERTLAAEGQRLAFEPADWRGLLGTTGEPTIGGMVAGNISGPRRVAVGACRDAMLGVRFIDGRGRAIKNGGRVMKNVTGYDLVKLLAGSWGTLGVLTEVSFKVQAIPAAEATLIRRGVSAADGVAALTTGLGTPYDVTGAAWTGGAAMLRIEGMAGSVAYRRDALARVLGAGWDLAEGADSAALWRAVRDVTAFAGRDGVVWRVSVKPTDGPRLLAALGDPDAVLDWGGGLCWLLLPENVDMRAALAPFGGHATRLRGHGAGPVFQPEAAPVAALSARLRAEFDPKGLFNPGLMT